MNSKLSPTLAVLALALIAATSRADVVQSTFNVTENVPLAGLGQSFTADASVVNLLQVMVVQINNDPNMSLTAELYSGQGYGGPLLDSDVLNLPNVLPTHSPLFFDFTGNTLTPGSVYSIRLVPTGALSLQAANTNPYIDGSELDNVGFPLASIGGADLRFTIHGEAAVPEPASLTLIGLAAALLCGQRRR
jgi:hypothetical protein